MKNIILTLAFALVSSFALAQNAKSVYENMKKVEGTEHVNFPSFILKTMNKGMADKAKYKKQRIVMTETNAPEFCKQLILEAQKLLDNGFKLVERPVKDGITQLNYLFGDDKAVKEIVTIHKKGEAIYPMIHIVEGTFQWSQFTTDPLAIPEIDEAFMKKADALLEDMLKEYAPGLLKEMFE